MSRFGSDPRDFFDSVYGTTPPWEIGRPQPAMAALLEKFPPLDPVLDLGCGSGDLSIHVAQLGHPVLGIDFVETAITQARQKRSSVSAETVHLLDFQVADATKPSLLERQFGSVVDSGFFHLFNEQDCAHLVDEVAGVLVPGGRYYIHAFSFQIPAPNMPRAIRAEEFQTYFTPDKGWKTLTIETAEFLSNVAPPIPAVAGCFEKLADK